MSQTEKMFLFHVVFLNRLSVIFPSLSFSSSCSGVVNVCTHDVCLRETNPKPVKAIMNLVTAATSLTFNPTTEILAVASSAADDAVKLVSQAFILFSEGLL